MRLEDEIIAATIAVKVRMEARQFRSKTAQEATRRMWLDIQRAKSWLNMCNQEGVNLQCQSKNAGTLRSN